MKTLFIKKADMLVTMQSEGDLSQPHTGQEIKNGGAGGRR